MPAKKQASNKPVTSRATKKVVKPARTAKVAPKKRAAANSAVSKKTRGAVGSVKKTKTTKKPTAKKAIKKTVKKSVAKKPVAVASASISTKHKPRYDYALAFLLTLSAVLLIGYTARVVTAAEFAEPPGGPSEGNIPVTVWNRDATVIGGENGIWPEKQQDTSINIDGQVYIGDETFEFGNDGVANYLLYGVYRYLDGPSGGPYTYFSDSEDDFLRFDFVYSNYPSAGQSRTYERFSVGRTGGVFASGGGTFNGAGAFGYSNYRMTQDSSSTYLLSGIARFDAMNASANYQADPDLDYFARFRSYDYTHMPSTTTDYGYTDRFTVSVTGDIWAKENIKSDGCFGPTFIGLTTTGGTGGGVFRPQDVAGYYGANNRCQADYTDYPGAHVCQISEILESIKCSQAGDPFRSVPDASRAWVNGGPPGHISNYNDCEGWSSSSAASYARYWIFDTITGGRGTGVSCNTTNGLQFACCY